MKRLPSFLAMGLLYLSFTACHQSEIDKTPPAITLEQPSRELLLEADRNATVVAAQQATIDSMKMEMVKQQVVDSMQKVANTQKATAGAVVAPAPRKAAKGKSRVNRNNVTSSNGGYSTAPVPGGGGYSNGSPTEVYEPAPVPAKRGWSAKAKGAVIGAGVGAVGGAIINKKNRGAGAVIGGLGGAAVGTGVGAVIDRKKGR